VISERTLKRSEAVVLLNFDRIVVEPGSRGHPLAETAKKWPVPRVRNRPLV